ncbi:hypothetical protein [Rhizobium sp.]
MLQKMQGHETLADVIDKLAKPEDYLLGVKRNLEAYRRNGIEPSMKLGTTGGFSYPNYLIARRQFRKPDETTDDKILIVKDLKSNLGSYSGRSHKPLGWSLYQIEKENWSTGSTNFDGFMEVFATFRGIKLSK